MIAAIEAAARFAARLPNFPPATTDVAEPLRRAIAARDERARLSINVIVTDKRNEDHHPHDAH